MSLLRIPTTAREKVLLSALDSRSTSKATDLWRRVHSKGYFSYKCRKQARHFNKSLKYNPGLILACPLIFQYFELRTNTLRDDTENHSIIVYHVRINFLWCKYRLTDGHRRSKLSTTISKSTPRPNRDTVFSVTENYTWIYRSPIYCIENMATR